MPSSAAWERRPLRRAPALAPSVTFSQNTGFGQLTIRGIGANVVFAGADPSSAMYLDGVYLARPAMAFVRFLDLDRIEVLRGPQGTLYGRNAVGGAMNLILRPPTNDFQASARFTAGNFGELRADARVSGPLKRDRVMGSVAFARASATVTSATSSIRTIRLAATMSPPHGASCASSSIAGRICCCRATSTTRVGTPLTFNKVLAAKPGFQFDNPPDLHDVRSSASPGIARCTTARAPRLTMALTPVHHPGQPDGVSKRWTTNSSSDADITELDLITTHQHERQHQLSQEITISHQQPRLTWVGGVFLFDESDHQTFWVDQPAADSSVGSTRASTRPAARCSDRRRSD